MTNGNTLKFLMAVLLFGMWFALVILGKADVTSFVVAVGSALTGVGVFHATMASPPDGDSASPSSTIKGETS